MTFISTLKQAALREVSTKKSSLFWTETDKPADKNESLSESVEIISEHVDDDNDETVPHWFRQLEQHCVESASEEFDTSVSQEVKIKNHQSLKIEWLTECYKTKTKPVASVLNNYGTV